MNNLVTNRNISKSVLNGGYHPHKWLTNISVAYFQDNADFIAPSIFPVVPVDFDEGSFPIFNKGDLNRDNFRQKPEYGHVDPAVISSTRGHYNVQVDQMIMGRDKIKEVNWSRMGVPGTADPRIAQAKTLAYQSLIHLDKLWASNFFKEGVWGKELKGVAGAGDGTTTFTQFSDSNSETIKLINTLKREFRRENGVFPNVMALGIDVFDSLINNDDILGRVIAGGSTINPAVANESVLAQLFGIPKVFEMVSTANMAEAGLEDDMQFIADPKSVFLGYVNPNPAIDQASAGYIFSWDPTGNGQPITITEHEGNSLDHTSFLEGLTAFDMNVVCPNMGIFLTNAV